MKKLLLFVISLITVHVYGQPVILNGNNIPAPGISVPVSFASTTLPGSPGANQTWDFSSLSFSSMGIMDVIAPSSSPIGSSFPTANHALSLQGMNSYSFFNISQNKMEVLAWTISSAGSGNDYSPNPRTMIKFPFNYLDTENDTWQKAGGSLENVTLTYDGYGTLFTPGATYTNVIRVKEDYGGGEVDYQWYIQNPLIAIAIFDHNNNRLIHFGAAQISGMNDQDNSQILLEMYPNPANEIVTVKNIPDHSTIKISDITGKIISQSEDISDETMINTSEYINGIYFIHVENNGKSANLKLVVNN